MTHDKDADLVDEVAQEISMWPRSGEFAEHLALRLVRVIRQSERERVMCDLLDWAERSGCADGSPSWMIFKRGIKQYATAHQIKIED